MEKRSEPCVFLQASLLFLFTSRGIELARCGGSYTVLKVLYWIFKKYVYTGLQMHSNLWISLGKLMTKKIKGLCIESQTLSKEGNKKKRNIRVCKFSS